MGSTVNIEDFYQAARLGDIDKMVTMLSSGVIQSVNRRDSKGNTAFIVAAGRGQTAVLQMLLANGAQLEDTSKGGLLAGKTALCWASSQGRENAVSFLISAGADVNHATEDGVFQGKTPLMWASSQGKAGVVSVLVNAGAEVDYSSNVGNFKGKTSLMWASSQGRVDVVLRLLEAGAEVDLVDNDGLSALMWATGSEGENEENQNKGLFEKAFKGHDDVVRALLKFGASVDIADKDGITALMYASFHGHLEAAKTLINAGADASLRNTAGKTALFLAQSNGHHLVVEALQNGSVIMQLPVEKLLEVSVCGWVVAVLRQTEGAHFANIRASKYTIKSSCRILEAAGLAGPLRRLLTILEVAPVDEVINQLGIQVYAARMLAKRELMEMIDKVASHPDSTFRRRGNLSEVVERVVF